MRRINTEQLNKLSFRNRIRALQSKVHDQNERIKYLLTVHDLWLDGRYVFPDEGVMYKETEH